MIKPLNKFRLALGLRGLAAVLFGAIALAWPGMTLLALVVVFGVYALADGVILLVGSLASPKELREEWLVPLLGVLGIAFGAITLARPEMTALLLLLLIAARAIFVGCLEVSVAVHHRKIIRGEWLLILSGVVSMLFGLAIFAYPIAGALTIVWLIGAYALVIGVLQTLFAVSARELITKIQERMSPPPVTA